MDEIEYTEPAEKKRRHFAGVTKDFKDDIHKGLNKRALKAYLKGHSRFRYGRDKNGMPFWFTTPVEYK
jgi:hypothetical protein